MPDLALFVEDSAHVSIVTSMLRAMARRFAVDVNVEVRSRTKGLPTLRQDLRDYVLRLEETRAAPHDGIVVAVDGNCYGFAERKRMVDEWLGAPGVPTITAIPDPHVERWLLLDPGAVREAVGAACQATAYKCERGVYKDALKQAVRDAGLRPLLGGIEHADAIVRAMDLDRTNWADTGLEHFLGEIRRLLRPQPS